MFSYFIKTILYNYVNYVKFRKRSILEKTCNVCLTHPKYVKAIKGKKTDKKDAKWISELFKCDLVRSSFIPPPDIRQLRDLCRYYVKLTGFASSEKNRAQNCLTTCNDLKMIAACMGGAEHVNKIRAMLEDAGFVNIKLTPKDNSKEIVNSWEPGKNLEDFIASYIIEGEKK